MKTAYKKSNLTRLDYKFILGKLLILIRGIPIVYVLFVLTIYLLALVFLFARIVYTGMYDQTLSLITTTFQILLFSENANEFYLKLLWILSGLFILGSYKIFVDCLKGYKVIYNSDNYRLKTRKNILFFWYKGEIIIDNNSEMTFQLTKVQLNRIKASSSSNIHIEFLTNSKVLLSIHSSRDIT
jgi:hypothetical protein